MGTLFLALRGLEGHDVESEELGELEHSELGFRINRIVTVVQFATEIIETIIEMLTVGRLEHQGMIIVLPGIVTASAFLFLAAIADITAELGTVQDFVQLAVRVPPAVERIELAVDFCAHVGLACGAIVSHALIMVVGAILGYMGLFVGAWLDLEGF